MAKKTKRKDVDAQAVMEEMAARNDPRTVIVARGFVAKWMNVDESEVPEDLDSVLRILVYMQMMKAIAGGDVREIFDRLAPKPRRVEISAPGGGPVRLAVGGADASQRELAARYFEEMAAGPAAIPAGPVPGTADDEEDLLA